MIDLKGKQEIFLFLTLYQKGLADGFLEEVKAKPMSKAEFSNYITGDSRHASCQNLINKLIQEQILYDNNDGLYILDAKRAEKLWSDLLKSNAFFRSFAIVYERMNQSVA